MSEVVVREPASIEANRPANQIDKLRQAISEITSIEQTVEANTVITGLNAYARAKQSLELVNEAIELRIWAERKGGEAIAKSGDKLSSLHRKHGIQHVTAWRWLTLYLIDEKFIKAYIADTVASGKQLSVQNLVSLGRDAGRKKVAPGVFKELSGLFTIEWKEFGRKQRAGNYKTRQAAIEALEQRKRTAPKREASTEAWQEKHKDKALTTTYGLLRRTLDHARTVPPSPKMDEVYSLLYRAEDLLDKIIKGIPQ